MGARPVRRRRGGAGGAVSAAFAVGGRSALDAVPGPLSLLGSFNQSWLVWGRPAIGLVAGLLFTGWVIIDSPVLRLSNDRIRVQRRGEVERVIERAKVDAV